MRIIAGIAKRRRLVAPEGRTTRPTPDRVREALFSMLGTRVVGAHVLDLFAGSGALGLEALSRGAAHATFVDNAASAVRCLSSNLAALKELASQATVLRSDAFVAIEGLKKTKKAPFDLVFLDPPYADALVAKVLVALSDAKIVAPHAIIVADHAKAQTPPARQGGFLLLERRVFGEVAIAIWQNGRGAQASEP